VAAVCAPAVAVTVTEQAADGVPECVWRCRVASFAARGAQKRGPGRVSWSENTLLSSSPLTNRSAKLRSWSSRERACLGSLDAALGCFTLAGRKLHYGNYWCASAFAPFAVALGSFVLIVATIRKRF
jgi:hypothetical protein